MHRRKGRSKENMPLQYIGDTPCPIRGREALLNKADVTMEYEVSDTHDFDGKMCQAHVMSSSKSIRSHRTLVLLPGETRRIRTNLWVYSPSPFLFCIKRTGDLPPQYLHAQIEDWFLIQFDLKNTSKSEIRVFRKGELLGTLIAANPVRFSLTPSIGETNSFELERGVFSNNQWIKRSERLRQKRLCKLPIILKRSKKE